MVGVDPGYLNMGLMKPRKGFTLVAGKGKMGVGKKIGVEGFHLEHCMNEAHTPLRK